MTDLKPGWKRVKFGELANCINDRVDDPSTAGVERYVGLEHLDPESLTIRRWGSPEDVESTKLRFKPGDIIFGKRRAYQRKLAVADFEGICSAHAMVLRAKSAEVLPEFLPFFMQSDLFMERAVEISVGSLSPTINWKALAQQDIFLPPPKEQESACHFLRRLSDLAKSRYNLLSASKVLHRAYIDSTLSMGAGQPGFNKYAPQNLSPDWTYQTIEELCSEIADCLHRTPEYAEEGFPAIRTSDIEPCGILRWQNSYRVSREEFLIQTSRLLPRAGDILFSREGERMGMAALVPEGVELCISQRMMHLRAKSGIPPDLVAEYLNSSWVQRQISMCTSGSTSPHVNVGDVKGFMVPVPPKDLRARISSRCRELLQAVVAAEQAYLDARKLSSKLLNHMLAGVMK
jgi:type I restriction enzyme, S subunit